MPLTCRDPRELHDRLIGKHAIGGQKAQRQLGSPTTNDLPRRSMTVTGWFRFRYRSLIMYHHAPLTDNSTLGSTGFKSWYRSQHISVQVAAATGFSAEPICCWPADRSPRRSDDRAGRPVDE